MSTFEAFVLGILQGLTEFLPVSSSGHLVLLQHIFHISEGTLLFDTMVHVGTLAAVFVVLWKDIWKLLRRPMQSLTGFLILATLPVVVIALLFKDRVEEAFASAKFLGFAFLATAVILFIAERLSRLPGRIRGEREMNWLDALVVGIMQGVAIIPGISRSGSTLSGALARKLNRDFAARFSFLLSIPAILGALVLQIKDIAGQGSSLEIDIAPLIIGTLAAAVTGFFSVKLMLQLVRRHALWGFAIYVAILGVLVLADQYRFHIFF